jgi:septal ring factor EnvC (AmiA/AmiB activator)
VAHQLDRTLEDLDKAMAQLRRAMKDIPARRQAFKANHDRMARKVAQLTVALADSRSVITNDNPKRRKR